MGIREDGKLGDVRCVWVLRWERKTHLLQSGDLIMTFRQRQVNLQNFAVFAKWPIYSVGKLEEYSHWLVRQWMTHKENGY